MAACTMSAAVDVWRTFHGPNMSTSAKCAPDKIIILQQIVMGTPMRWLHVAQNVRTNHFLYCMSQLLP